MKNYYAIVKHAEGRDLYYLENFNIFGVGYGTIYTNKRTATEKMRYAKGYGTGCHIPGPVEIINLPGGEFPKKYYINGREHSL